MKQRLERISIFQASKLGAGLYGLIGLLYVIPGGVMIALGEFGSGIMFIIMALFMSVFGFLGMALVCWIYNFLAKAIGGFEYEVEIISE